MDKVVASPTLPLYAGGPLALLALGLLLLLIRSTHSKAAVLLLAAIWTRYVLSAFPGVALHVLPIGISVNAVVSLAVTGIGLLVLSRRTAPMLAVPPVAAICVLIALSGIINHNLGEGIDTIIRYAYFLVLIFAIVEAADDLGFSDLMSRLLLVHFVPLAFQFASLVLGVAKASEADGSASYIGGYGHESSFSIVLVTGILVTALNRRIPGWGKMALIGVFIVGVILSNYRTSVLSMLPFLAAVSVIGFSSRVVARQRALALGFALAALCGLATVAPQIAGDRFAILGDVFSEGTGLIKPPADYTISERKLLSGRAYVWAGYYEAFLEGSPRQKLLGHGQDSWSGTFKIYAHNTLVSQLYELGILGVFLMSGLWAWMLIIAARARGTIGAVLVSAHLSFIVLNMGTMPLWQVEGLILYAMICGASFHYFRQARQSAEVSADDAIAARSARFAARSA